MKKVSSILLIIVFVLSFAASPCFSGFAFANSPVTWEDLGEDAIALRDSYFNLWRSGSAGDFFRNAADIPVSWFKMLSDGVLALSPIDDLFFTYEEVKPVIRTGSPKMRDWVSKHNITPDTPVISSDDFSDKIDEQNSEYTPKGELIKISYRTDEMFQTWTNFPSTPRTTYYYPYVLDNSLFAGTKNAQKMYFILFADIDGNQYYSQNQFEMWFDVSEVFDDEGNFTNYFKTLSLKYWDVMESSEADSTKLFTTAYDFSDYKFMQLTMSPGSSYFCRAFPTFSGFLNEKQPFFNVTSSINKYDTLYSPDFSSSFDYLSLLYNSNHGFVGNYANHSASCIYDDNCDIGLLVSSNPIDFTYRDIDTTKIPSGQIVTINGDTIYNYNITNPDTGDSSKFGDYITNNYTYITNNYGGESGGSSGSGVGGNVTVGGSIDVGGSVGVDISVSVPDININVNGNGSGAGGSSSLPDTDLVENLPEAPSGFIDYTASLFSFLPAEILNLLIAGLAAAIFCRIWGR